MTIYSRLSYLEKQRFLPRQISIPPSHLLRTIIVIPSFAEDGLIHTLNSLETCLKPDQPIEVLIVLNSGKHHEASILEANAKTRANFLQWNHNRQLNYHLIEAVDLPKKHAGVGLARKIGMDEAVDRLEQAEAGKSGLIVNLDADSLVDENYLQVVSQLTEDRQHDAWSIHFEHPLEGNQFEQEVYKGIVLYELFLRYYIEGLRYAGYPMAFHTIGSSMAVRSTAYQAQLGMNRRKAGEDFYFLHKYSILGKLGECNDTTVIPSPRPAMKVPFGTGKAIQNYLDRGDGSWDIYPPEVFQLVKEFLLRIGEFQTGWPQRISSSIETYLKAEGLPDRLPDMRQHATSEAIFFKRFYAWLDPLKMLRLIHHLRDLQKEQIPITDACRDLIGMTGQESSEGVKEMLTWYRERQKVSGVPSSLIFPRIH